MFTCDVPIRRALYWLVVLVSDDTHLTITVFSFLLSLIFFRSVTRREHFNNRVVQFLSAWSLRHHPRIFRYAVLLSSGEVVLCADPSGLCSGPSNLGNIFVLSIYHFERSCSAFVASFFVFFGRSCRELTLWNPFWRRYIACKAGSYLWVFITFS